MPLFRILRYDPTVDQLPCFQEYQVETSGAMTVLDALFEILERQDGSLGFRYSCRHGVCGSCAMHINGKYRLACQSQVSALEEPIVIRPLGHMSVIKDLVVDQDPFFSKYARIKPWLMNDEPPPERERLQSPAERRALDGLVECILCMCCNSGCTMTESDGAYLGPALLLKADRFASDCRDRGLRERVAAVDSEHGLWRCHQIFNCVEVCPKDLHPAVSIARMRRRAFWAAIFGRRKRK